MGVRALRRGDARFVRGVESAVADVVHDRAGEEVGVLKHRAERLAQGILADFAHVDAVIGDRAAVDLVKAVDEVRDRGLARAGGADEGDLLTRLREHADVAQDGLFGDVAEVHMLEPHVAAQGDERAVRLFPGPRAMTLLRLHGRQHDLALVDLRRGVHHVEDALRAREGGHDGVELLADLFERASDLARVEQVGGEAAEVKAHDEREEAAERGGRRVADVGDVGAQGDDRAGVIVRVRRGGAVSLVELRELLLRDLLVGERLDDLEPLDDLLNIAVDLTERRLLLAVINAAAAAEDLEHAERRGERQKRYEEQNRRGIDHHGDESDEGQSGGEHVDEALLHREGNVVRVVREAAHQLAVGVAVKIAERQALERVEQVAAQVVRRVVGKARHGRRLHIGCGGAQQIEQQQENTAAEQLLHLFRRGAVRDKTVDDRAEHIGPADGRHGADDEADRDENERQGIFRHISDQAADGLFCVLRLLIAAARAGTAGTVLALCSLEFLLLFGLCFAHCSITPSCWEL